MTSNKLHQSHQANVNNGLAVGTFILLSKGHSSLHKLLTSHLCTALQGIYKQLTRIGQVYIRHHIFKPRFLKCWTYRHAMLYIVGEAGTTLFWVNMAKKYRKRPRLLLRNFSKTCEDIWLVDWLAIYILYIHALNATMIWRLQDGARREYCTTTENNTVFFTGHRQIMYSRVDLLLPSKIPKTFHEKVKHPPISVSWAVLRE